MSFPVWLVLLPNIDLLKLPAASLSSGLHSRGSRPRRRGHFEIRFQLLHSRYNRSIPPALGTRRSPPGTVQWIVDCCNLAGLRNRPAALSGSGCPSCRRCCLHPASQRICHSRPPTYAPAARQAAGHALSRHPQEYQFPQIAPQIQNRTGCAFHENRHGFSFEHSQYRRVFIPRRRCRCWERKKRLFSALATT